MINPEPEKISFAICASLQHKKKKKKKWKGKGKMLLFGFMI